MRIDKRCISFSIGISAFASCVSKKVVSFFLWIFVALHLMACANNSYENGMMYYQNGEFVRALPYLEEAANMGNADAQNKIGLLYGKVIKPQNKHLAMKWLQKSANQGLADGQYSLGMAYYFGELVDQDIVKSIFWLEKSASQGNVDAIKSLDGIYASDFPDNAKRFYWVNKGAELNDAYLQCTLGDLYFNGIGVDKNSNTALSWYLRSSEQGVKDSSYADIILGKFYRDGIVVNKDIEMSNFYFKKAEKLGVPLGELK